LTREKQASENEEIVLNFDGLCEPKNPGGIATYGVVARRGNETIFEDSGLAKAKPWTLEASNNVAEYSALIRGLGWLLQSGFAGSRVVVRGDSKIVINQLNGIFKIKAPRLLELYREAKSLVSKFRKIRIEWVDRSKNSEADLLSRIAYHRLKRQFPKG
jgi:ribonuclease HI